MQAKVPPAACFPHNKNAKWILRRSTHIYTQQNFFWGGASCVKFCIFMRRRLLAPCVYDEMSNMVQQCQISSPVVALVAFGTL